MLNTSQPFSSVPMNKSQVVQTELIRIQKLQLDHDEFYHREIARLPIGSRLQHMALHISKYFSRIVMESTRSDVQPKAWIDTFIISTSTCNILNVRLYDLWSSISPIYDDHQTLESWIQILEQETLKSGCELSILASANLEFSNAAEKIDHIESYDYRKFIAMSVKLLSVISAAKIVRNQNLRETVLIRLNETKIKNIFHGV